MTSMFGCAVNCIDGRAQLPVIEWVKFHGHVQYVDVVTEPGAVGVINGNELGRSNYIRERVLTSVRVHSPLIIAVAGHFGCIANPVGEEKQKEQIRMSVDSLRSWHDRTRVVGLFVNEYGSIDLVSDSDRGHKEIRSFL